MRLSSEELEEGGSKTKREGGAQANCCALQEEDTVLGNCVLL